MRLRFPPSTLARSVAFRGLSACRGGWCTNNLMINKINHPSKFVKSKYKIGLVGAYGSGKSSLANRFAHGSFSDEYRMTLKFNSFSRTVQLEDCLFLKLELIDTLGSAPSIRYQQQHFKDLDAVLLLYDITNEQSFCKLEEFLGQLREHLGQKTLLALVGTHCDQPFKRQVTYQEAMRLKKRSGFSLLYEVSSSSGENVAELFQDLAKYLLILNNYREKEENPQASTNYDEEKQTISQPSRIVLLEKKLAYKEEECKNLWKDYEAALSKIEALETRNLFESSYVLNYANDPEDSLKNSKMQQESRGTYSQRRSEIEQEYALSLQSANRKASEYREEAERLSSELKKMTAELNIIEKIIEDQQLSFKELLERKGEELSQASEEILQLNQKTAYLSSIVEQEIKHRSEQKIASDGAISRLQEELAQNQERIEKLQASNQTLSFQKEYYIKLLEQSELVTLHYRGEASQKELLQAELSLEEEKCIKMQLHYKQDLAHLKENYELIIANLRREKEFILQGNSKVVNKIIESKVNQIKLIRSFIDEMETRKDGKQQNHSLLESKSGSEEKVRQFFSSFLDLLKENSQYVLFNLEQLEGSLEEVENLVGGMIEQVSKLDLTELLYDVKEKEGLRRDEEQEMSHRQHQIWLMVNMESEKKVAKLVAGLEELQGKVNESSQDLRNNISHISESLSKIEQLSEMGIEAYVDSLQN